MPTLSDQCQLIEADCLDALSGIADQSIDLIASDLPYGITACKWDQIIPLEPLWAHFKRVLKPRGAVVLTASQPFTSMLVMSNPKWFRYTLVWDKVVASGHLNCAKMPMRSHEDILVFAVGNTIYNAQKVQRTDAEIQRLCVAASRRDRHPQAYGSQKAYIEASRIERSTKQPVSIVRFNRRVPKDDGIHPTQKPVALFEYLIRTYSNEGETVLDCAMGSGTTGVACLNTGRRFIGIERDPAYFAIARERLRLACQSSGPIAAPRKSSSPPMPTSRSMEAVPAEVSPGRSCSKPCATPTTPSSAG